jgi:FixJ family two-component response regulator
LSSPVIISIVDDDESVRTAMGRLVRSLGYRSHEFASAEAFLASPQRAETSCLIADIQMPGMSGLDLQEALLAQGHRLPIIFITAFPTDPVRKRAEAGGAAGFFVKPVDIQLFIPCLHAILNKPVD